MRPVSVNGVSGLGVRPDLIDRLVLLTLEQMPPSRRRPARELEAAFEAARARLFGALLEKLAAVLEELPHVELAEAPRMADFAMVGVALERVEGRSEGSFLAALEGQQGSALATVVDADPVGRAVLDLMEEHKEWSGEPSELYAVLSKVAGDDQSKRSWPTSTGALTQRLAQLATALRELGVEYERHHAGRDTDEKRAVTLRRVVPGGDGGDGGPLTA